MAELTLKNLYNKVSSPFVLDPTMTYPTIEGDTSNFLSEYNTNKAQYDRYFLKEHGKKTVEVDGDTDEDIILNWKNDIKAIQRVYLEAWAHQYYTLNIAYNPVYNVTEDTETTYGEHETENEYGAHEIENEYGQHETDTQYGLHETDTQYGLHETTEEYGATQDTYGQRTDTVTEKAVAYDTAAEKITGSSSNVKGQEIDSALAHTDTTTSKLHTDTVTDKLHTDTVTSKLHKDTTTDKLHTDTVTSKQHIDSVHREGNIGIKSASALAEEEIFLREKQIFFKNIFLTIIREVGAYYDFDFI